MAVYTDIDADMLADYLSGYEIGLATSFKGIAEGVENSNFYLETPKGRFILTLFEKRVNPKDLPYFVGLMEHLSAAGFPCPMPVKGKDGQALGRLAGKSALIVTFLNGLSLARPDADQCRQLGAGLARMHAALADFAMRRENSLGRSAWRPLFSGQEGAAEALAAGLSDLIEADLDRIDAAWPAALPTGTVHADLFPDNVFFLDGTFSGVIDFYFSCTDALAYDIAVCLNSWAFEPGGQYNYTKGQALIAGYQSVRTLDPAELEALPVLCAGAAIRFFLTRLHDWSNTPPGALVRPKNPMEYADKLGFHRNAVSAADYGA